METRREMVLFDHGELHHTVAMLERRLAWQRQEEQRRLVWLIEGIRQELNGIIGVEYLFEAPGDTPLSCRQREVLDIISLKGQNILTLLQRFYDYTVASLPGDAPVVEELVFLRVQIAELERLIGGLEAQQYCHAETGYGKDLVCQAGGENSGNHPDP